MRTAPSVIVNSRYAMLMMMNGHKAPYVLAFADAGGDEDGEAEDDIGTPRTDGGRMNTSAGGRDPEDARADARTKRRGEGERGGATRTGRRLPRETRARRARAPRSDDGAVGACSPSSTV